MTTSEYCSNDYCEDLLKNFDHFQLLLVAVLGKI